MSKTQYKLKYNYPPFIATGFLCALLLVRFLIQYEYNFKAWWIINLGSITLILFLIEIALIKLLGQFIVVKIYQEKDLLYFTIRKDGRLISTAEIEKIKFYWKYNFAEYGIGNELGKTTQLHCVLFAEIMYKAEKIIFLNEKLEFFQDLPKNWDHKNEAIKQKEELIDCYDLNKLKLLFEDRYETLLYSND